jgi:predicted DNA-binding transcriptional regulator
LAEERKHTLMDQYWRWHVVRECRVPNTYTTKPSKDYPKGIVKVDAHAVKAVLLEFAQWPLDKTIKMGLKRVAHETQMSLREAQKAVKVLIEHGLINREARARMGATKVTKLDWEKIEALRQSYKKTLASVNDDDEDDDDAADAAQAAEPSDELIETILSLKHIEKRLTRADAQRLATTLRENHGIAAAALLTGLSEKALISAANPETVSPVKFLVKCVENAHRAWVREALWPYATQSVADGVSGVWFADSTTRFDLTAIREECVALAGNEYTVGTFDTSQPDWAEVNPGDTFGCWLPISRLQPAAA